MSWDSDEKTLKTAKLSKTERIQFLRDNGFNCPEYHIVTRDNLDILHGGGHLSIRSSGSGRRVIGHEQYIGWSGKFMVKHAEKDENGDVKNPPHFPWIECGEEARDAATIIMGLGYTPIACGGISLEMNQMAGVIKAVKGRLPGYHDFIVEAALPGIDNPVGVRSVSHGGKIDIRLKLPQAIADLGQAGAFSDMWDALMRQRKLPWYLEFSYCDRPVGWKEQRLIFWEGHLLTEKAVGL